MSVKTKKLIIKIISISLAAIMIASVFASSLVGFATELSSDFYNETDEYYWQFDSEQEVYKPIKKDGFEGVIFQLSGMSDTFTQLEVKALIANVATKEVFPITFNSINNYVAAVPLEKGYYFLSSGGYAWADKSGMAKCINNNEPIFFSYGVENQTFWGYNFTDASTTQTIYLMPDISSCKKTVSPTVSLIMSKSDMEYPMELLKYEVFEYNNGDLEKTFTEIANSEVAPEGADKETFINSVKDLNLNSSSDNENSDDLYQDGENENGDPTLLPGIDDSEYVDDYNYNKDGLEGLELVEDKTEQSNETTGKVLFEVEKVERKPFFESFFIEHIGLWCVLIGTGIAYVIVKTKNKKKIEEQILKDSYDDSHID